MKENTQVQLIAKQKPLTAQEVKEHGKLIQEVLMDSMIKDVHYGIIPGTNKDTLYKPGAEKILTLFRIACDPEVTDLSTDDEFRFRVTVKGIHQSTGIFLGAGVGECSSNEEKYKWRGVVCQEEWEATKEDQRRVKWSKGYNGPAYSAQQVRTNPADLANTILKMAKKRGMVDMTLTVTAASDVFAQDLEDLPPELVAAHQEKQKTHQAKPRMASGNANKPATEGQCKFIRAKLASNQHTEEWLCEQFKIKQIEELTMSQVNDALAKAEE